MCNDHNDNLDDDDDDDDDNNNNNNNNNNNVLFVLLQLIFLSEIKIQKSKYINSANVEYETLRHASNH
jgi:hypothetical protein